MKNTYLHYPKTQKLLLKKKTACALALCRGIYRHRNSLEDETGPRVENRRVDHQWAADPRPYQGQTSLVLVRGFIWLLGVSWYIPILVFLPEYSSDVSKGLG